MKFVQFQPRYRKGAKILESGILRRGMESCHPFSGMRDCISAEGLLVATASSLTLMRSPAGRHGLGTSLSPGSRRLNIPASIKSKPGSQGAHHIFGPSRIHRSSIQLEHRQTRALVGGIWCPPRWQGEACRAAAHGPNSARPAVFCLTVCSRMLGPSATESGLDQRAFDVNGVHASGSLMRAPVGAGCKTG